MDKHTRAATTSRGHPHQPQHAAKVDKKKVARQTAQHGQHKVDNTFTGA